MFNLLTAHTLELSCRNWANVAWLP